MNHPRYPEYKDSGVDWLGLVPSHWVVTALKHGYSVTLGKMLQPDAASEDDALLPYLRAANIQWAGVDCTDVKSMWFSKRDREQLRLEAGDLLVSEGGDVGRSAIWTGDIEECYFQNSVNRVRPLAGNLTTFLAYWMSTMKDKGFIDVLCNKSTIAHFTAEKVGSVPVPFPPRGEQLAIAAFLDRETAKIDALVEEQKRLIELLKEKRQAVISQAVTKGLDPNVPMKDSGVAWLGDVPSHWGHARKLIDLAADEQHSFVNGPFGSDLLTSELVEDGVPVVYIRDIKPSGYRRVSEWHVTSEKAAQLKFCNVVANDIVIAKVGDPPGLAAVYPPNEPDGVVTQDVIRLRLNPQKASPRFIRWLLNSRYGQAAIDGISVESTRTRVGLGEYKQLRFFVPPKVEQEEIASALELKVTAIDTLFSEATAAVTLLQERRSALISAAVTGKIDVRGLVPQPEEATA